MWSKRQNMLFSACRVKRQIVLVGLEFSEANEMLVISLASGFCM